jgi:hypothetical protein
MDIQLKAVRHMESLSEETNCFTANLYVEGKKIAECGNHGHGGPTDIDYVRHPRVADIIERFKAHLKTLPPEKHGYETSKGDHTKVVDGKFIKEFEIPITDEFMVDRLLEKYLTRKWDKKLCRKGLCFRLKSTPKDQWEVTKGKYTPELAAKVRKRYGDELVEILNETIAS